MTGDELNNAPALRGRRWPPAMGQAGYGCRSIGVTAGFVRDAPALLSYAPHFACTRHRPDAADFAAVILGSLTLAFADPAEIGNILLRYPALCGLRHFISWSLL